jgi:hypothetical protein
MRILNLGAGVQSTTLFLMSHEGVIPPIDHAIFADTQEEPEAVYDHLAWLRTVPAPVLHRQVQGNLLGVLAREIGLVFSRDRLCWRTGGGQSLRRPS